MSKSGKKGGAFIVMVIGFVIGLIIGRGLEFDHDDDDEDDKD